ncbi:MAG: InlB B-repeat-containing protein [Bacilli bacterium]|nr:InlB B-repeat-containing protein [Bacilli bacterium]
MKKILSFLFILVFAFALVGCNNDNKGEDEKITVAFETNGGSTIANVTVDSESAKSFALPENPTKEGFVFDGWYLDAEFKTPFNSLNLENKTITLYAKWTEEDQGLNASVTFAFDVDVTVKDLKAEGEEDGSSTPENVKANGSIKIDASLESGEIEKLEDLKGTLTVTVNVSDLNALVGELGEEYASMISNPIVVSLYLQDGYAYVVYGLVTYKANLVTLLDAVKEAVEEEGILPEGVEIPETLDDVNALITEGIKYVNEDLGVDFEVLGSLLNALLVFVPEAKTENGKTVYEITQEDFEADLDSLVEYLGENADDLAQQIYNVVETIIESIFNSPKEEYTDNQGNVLSREKHGWTDTEGQFHSFEEDLDTCNFGNYTELVNVYECRYLRAKWDTKTWKELTDEEEAALYVGKTVEDYQGNKYTYGTPSYTKADGTVVSFLENFDQLESDSIGEYDEEDNTFYVYFTGEKYDVATGKLYDEEAAALEDISSAIEMYAPVVAEMLKEVIDIKTIKFIKGDGLVEAHVNVDVDTSEVAELIGEDIQAHIGFDFTANGSKAKVTITYPDFSQAIDVTEDILSGINGENPELE